jgi:hypothetical protein
MEFFFFNRSRSRSAVWNHHGIAIVVEAFIITRRIDLMEDEILLVPFPIVFKKMHPFPFWLRLSPFSTETRAVHALLLNYSFSRIQRNPP